MEIKYKILYEYVRGSHAHGIATEKSDIDTGGVFICPNESLFSIMPGDYKDEISDSRHDAVLWELNKFGRLLCTSNPTVLESLFIGQEFIKTCEPEFKIFLEKRDEFISKECFKPFGAYASGQIRKAKGLNKMINKPILQRLEPTDFCYIIYGNDTISFKDWLEKMNYKENDVSLAKLNHFRDGYSVFLHPGGILRPGANDLHVEDIPKGLESIATLAFNKDAYTSHCIDYKHQKEWEAKRNPVRYESNLGKSYDAKNISECIRLVRTCTEIAEGKGYRVNRMGIDSDFLLDVRGHKFEFDELMKIAEEDIKKMEEAIQNSKIRESVDRSVVNKIILQIRKGE